MLPHTGSGGFGGDARFLDPFLYDAACTCGGGTADFVNWKMLFDCQTLGAPCRAESKGLWLPRPSLSARAALPQTPKLRLASAGQPSGRLWRAAPSCSVFDI